MKSLLYKTIVCKSTTEVIVRKKLSAVQNMATVPPCHFCTQVLHDNLVSNKFAKVSTKSCCY